MISRRAAPLLLVGIVCAAGCITTRATTAPHTQLGQYRTFAFTPEASQTIARTPTGAVVRDAITQQLAARGIAPASPGTPPDFYVSYQLVLREELAAYGWGGGWGWGWGYGWGGPADVYQYTQGTLIVDFVDPKTHQSFWRGTATSIVNTPDNPSQKKIYKSVAKMLAKYPVELVASAPAPARM
jgi:hypothetical protein